VKPKKAKLDFVDWANAETVRRVQEYLKVKGKTWQARTRQTESVNQPGKPS